jgi:hypothetical protein
MMIIMIQMIVGHDDIVYIVNATDIPYVIPMCKSSRCVT